GSSSTLRSPVTAPVWRCSAATRANPTGSTSSACLGTRPAIPATACPRPRSPWRSEEHTSELQSRFDLVCRLLLEKKKKKVRHQRITYVGTLHHTPPDRSGDGFCHVLRHSDNERHVEYAAGGGHPVARKSVAAANT